MPRHAKTCLCCAHRSLMTDPVSSAHPVSLPVLVRVAAGDVNATRECLARYGGLVWSLARRLSRTEADAEDATQEIFVDLWKSANRFDPKVASEATFIAMIARRRLIDRRRRQQRRAEDPFPDASALIARMEKSGPSPEISAEASIAARALQELRPEERNAVILSSYYGLSHEEIAISTGMPLGTVKTHARRGLMRVRELLLGAASAVTSAVRRGGTQ
jgi:RNA polymerase sigma factor (sigma-70 family)